MTSSVSFQGSIFLYIPSPPLRKVLLTSCFFLLEIVCSFRFFNLVKSTAFQLEISPSSSSLSLCCFLEIESLASLCTFLSLFEMCGILGIEWLSYSFVDVPTGFPYLYVCFLMRFFRPSYQLGLDGFH